MRPRALLTKKTITSSLIVIWLTAGAVAALLQKLYDNRVWTACAAAILGTSGSVLGIVLAKHLADTPQFLGGRAKTFELTSNAHSQSFKQLPHITSDFVGRHQELLEIGHKIRASRHSTSLTVVAISGRAGVGKTALALRAAHDLTRYFPDGQFYIDMRGGNAQTLMPPEEVLASLLTELGMDASNIPSDVTGRSRLFRQRTADYRALFLFDNVTNVEQLRHLLPGAPPCAVIVTSRVRLVSLEGAHSIDLSEFDDQNSIELLGSIIGKGRVAAEAAAALEIAHSCGRLPLALRIAGARLSGRPAWSLTRLASVLSDETQVLDTLQSADLAVRATLRLSYDAQSSRARAAFRNLALTTISDFAAWPIAAVSDCPIHDADSILDELAEARLIDPINEDAVGQLRYRLHDLVRDYSRECSNVEESDHDRRNAVRLLVDSVLKFATQAESILMPGTATSGKSLTTRAQKVSKWSGEMAVDPAKWLEVEVANVIHVIRLAYEAGMWSHTWELADKLVAFLDPRALWDEWQITHEMALEAAERAGSTFGEATILRNLSVLHRLRGNSELSEAEAKRAMQLYEAADDPAGQADCMANLAWIYRRRGKTQMAIELLESAVGGFRRHSAPRGEGWALYMLADIYIDVNTDRSIEHINRVVDLFNGTNDGRSLGWGLRLLGDIRRERNEFADAIAAYETGTQALRDVGDRRGEARAIGGLAQLYQRNEHLADAARLYEECSRVFERLGDDRWAVRTLSELRVIYLRMGKRKLARSCTARVAALASPYGDGKTIEPALRL